jgi:hypothetical protein
MKKFISLLTASLIFAAFGIIAAQAAPVTGNIYLNQTVNQNTVFSTGVFTEAISDIDGGTFTSLEILSLPSPSAGTLNYDSVPASVNGEIPASELGFLVFVPVLDYEGAVSFTYSINNGVTDSNSGTVNIEYSSGESAAEPGGDTPSAKNAQIYVKKNMPKNIQLAASDPESRPLTYTVTQQPGHGSLNEEGISSGLVVYTPATDYLGADEFIFKVNNGIEDSAPATVTITVSTNTPPAAHDNLVHTTINGPVQIELEAEDEDGNALTYAITDGPSHGALNEDNIASGVVTYTPDGSGENDLFKFKANDGEADSNEASVTVEIIEAGPAAPEFVYEDLKEHWGNFSAGSLADRGLIVGEKSGNKYFFYPEIKITRWEFLNYVIGALGLEGETPDLAVLERYEDTDGLPAYIKRIAAIATEADILHGSEEGGKLYVLPYGYLTRAEAIQIMGNKLTPGEESEDSLSFDDKGEIPGWALQQFINMKNYGIINGFDDGTVKPNGILTKAQITEMLFQAVKYLEKEAM